MCLIIQHVCKRSNREMFTIIPLVGDVPCLIPFVGLKTRCGTAGAAWNTSKLGFANVIQQINNLPWHSSPPPNPPVSQLGRRRLCCGFTHGPSLSFLCRTRPPIARPAGNESQTDAELPSTLHTCLFRDSPNNGSCHLCCPSVLV